MPGIDPSKTPVEALIEEVKSLGKAVGDKVSELDARVKTVEEKSTAWQNDMSNLNETVTTWKKTGVPVDMTRVETAVDEILTKQEAEHVKARSVLPNSFSKTIVPDVWKSTSLADLVALQGEVDEFSVRGLLSRGRDGFMKLMQLPPFDENHKHLLRFATDVKIADSITRLTLPKDATYKGFSRHFPKLSKAWALVIDEYMRAYDIDTKAMDKTDQANWVPEGWSSELREIIQLQLAVAGLFERIMMPQDPYNLPIDMTDTLGSFLGETTGYTNPYDDSVSQAFDDQKTQFASKKLRGRFLTSAELSEDAIVPLLSLMRTKLVNILAQSLETAILNGATGTHIDYDTEQLGATDVRRMWDGIRKFCNANSYETGLGGAAPTVANLNTMRGKMGEFGVAPDEIAIISPISAYVYFIGDTSVKTVDVFGPYATILTGQLARVHGIPIIVSRHARQDLAATGVNTSGGPNTLTAVQMVNRRCWMIGDRRQITLESERLINTDQTNVVAFQRVDFKNLFNFGSPKPTVAWQLINVLN